VGRYNPQGVVELEKYTERSRKKNINSIYQENTLTKSYVQKFTNYPNNILEFNGERGFHPTQKPVGLFEYLIKTYTKEGEVVLDSCIGSGTTAIACINTDRNYIGFEKDTDIYKVATERVKGHIKNS